MSQKRADVSTVSHGKNKAKRALMKALFCARPVFGTTFGVAGVIEKFVL